MVAWTFSLAFLTFHCCFIFSFAVIDLTVDRVSAPIVVFSMSLTVVDCIHIFFCMLSVITCFSFVHENLQSVSNVITSP
jgi:hypothetical protein